MLVKLTITSLSAPGLATRTSNVPLVVSCRCVWWRCVGRPCVVYMCEGVGRQLSWHGSGAESEVDCMCLSITPIRALTLRGRTLGVSPQPGLICKMGIIITLLVVVRDAKMWFPPLLPNVRSRPEHARVYECMEPGMFDLRMVVGTSTPTTTPNEAPLASLEMSPFS